jgi:transcriptional regulator with PAS, ATPase and Fis domain
MTFIQGGELAIITTSFLIKAYLLKMLIPSGFHNLTLKRPWVFLLGTLLGSIIGDFGWIIKLLREMQIIHLSYASLIFLMRISWAFLVLQYQSLSLFLESLIVKKFVFNIRHKILCTFSACLSLYFIAIASLQSGYIDELQRKATFKGIGWSMSSPLELSLMNFAIYYALFCLMLVSIGVTLSKSQRIHLPIIVKHQLALLLKFLIGSHLFVEILQLISFMISATAAYIYPTVTVSTLILSYAMYYSVNKVLGIRFLNVNTHVQSKPNLNLIHNFKYIVEQLSHVTCIPEVGHITQTFFKEAFDIPLHKSQLYIRMQETQPGPVDPHTHTMSTIVENFLTTHNNSIREYIYKSKILIYDELEFSNFYHDTSDRRIMLAFLKNLDADIFLPIYEKKDIIAYIIVERHPRKKELYGNVERDEMIILANYLCNIIHLLQHRNLQSLILQEKELKDELHQIREEYQQYKESIRSFILNHQKQIGVIFYKNRRFYFGNQSAKELIGINLNTQNGHSLAKTCRQIVYQASEYKTAQTLITHDEKGDNIVLSAVPNLEQNNIILLVHQPEINDLISKDISLLQDPTKWDYLLYLQTTKAGKLISQLVPGSGEMLLNFKINLLRAALSKKAILLILPDDDLMPTVELLHHMNGGETLHTLKLNEPCKDRTIGFELFGHSQILDNNPNSTPLFKKLGERGTLYIKNIHFLDIETQEYLAEYIKYGHYRVINSEQRIAAGVRLLCSTNQNLITLVQAGTFSPTLFNLINKMTLTMTPLESLPKKELDSLADGLTEQAVKTADFKNMLELNDKEKMKLAYNRPTSLQHMRIQVEKLLVHKSKKNHIFQETYFDPAYHITDPELTEAARLGKHALRDQRIMTLLWDKFHSQNKIASFLGVNRSSVNRRCKQFNLE